MFGPCVMLSEGLWLVSAGITVLLEPEQNTKDHRFQQPQFWVSNGVVALKRVFCLFSECLQKYIKLIR